MTEPTRPTRPAAGPAGIGGRGLPIGRIAGVEVVLDWSLIIIFLLVALSLGGGLLPAWHPDWGVVKVFSTAAAAAILLIASILVHELSHAIVGRWLGIRVPRITLFVFGGMAQLEGEPRTWQAELGMAAAGPIVSLALGVAMLVVAGWIIGPMELDPADPADALARLGPVASVLIWLGPVNIVLGLFNLVPGFPLDGGRVLRAIFWGIGGDHARATALAAAGGQAVAWLLIGCGVAMILGLQVPVFGTGTLPGLWIALIGWFLNNAALASRRKVQVDVTLGDLPVDRIMRRDPVNVGPELTVEELIDGYMLRRSERAFPVLEQGRLLGLVCLDDVRDLEPEQRAERKVVDIMTPVADLAVLSPADAVSLALTRLAEHQVNQLPVVQNDRLVGLLTREAILRWLALCKGAVADGPGKAHGTTES